MIAECPLAQHDFSRDPVFVKNSNDGHLVRGPLFWECKCVESFGFSVSSRRIFREI